MGGCHKVLSSGGDNLKHWQEYYDRLAVKNVYSLPKYIKFLEARYEDEAMLFVYEDNDTFVYFPYFQKDLSGLELSPDAPGDLHGCSHIYSSWYYGGPLASTRHPDADFKRAFFAAWSQHVRNSGAVTEFIRFDANIENQNLFPAREIEYDRETVYVDLTQDEATIWKEFNQSNRWAVNRAKRDGLETAVRGPHETQFWQIFAEIYHGEMVRKNAPAHLNFDQAYFDRLRTELSDNVCLIVTSLDGEICGGVILIFGDVHCFGFLSATKPEYWRSQVNNLGWTEGIWWAKAQGYEIFDLMGGRPGVFKFKSHFSKSRSKFFVRKAIHDEDTFRRLLRERVRRQDAGIDTGERAFPAYL
jgi:hypothetical protein